MIEAWQVLGERYELGEILGTGGMAEVRRARDIRLGREVAIKLLRPEAAENEDIVTAFRAEAMASARLNHPGVVAVYDVGEADIAGIKRPYLVMEMIEGAALSTLLADGTALTVERSIEIGVDVCAALAHAHERGVVHRDVTPSNLMILPNGAVKVTDFGIARAVTRGVDDTDAGRGYGSVAFISPEQARRRPVDARSDLYSFGCVLMTMLTGIPPFEGTPAAVVAAHVKAPVPKPSSRRPGIDPGIDEVVLRCLAKDPWHRPQTAAELRRDLLRILVELDAVAARSAAAGGLAAPEHEGYDVTELPTARVASGLLPSAPAEHDHPPHMINAGPAAEPVHAPSAAPFEPGDEPAAHGNGPRHAAGSGAGLPGVAGATRTTEERSRPDGAGATGAGGPDAVGPAVGDGDGGRGRDRDGEGDDDRRPVGRRGWWLAAAVALLAVLATVVWAVLDTRTATSVDIPATTGLTVAEAEEVLADAGLDLGAPRAEASRDIDVGLVVGTDPEAGAVVERGTEVTLVISTGPAQIPVPEVEGLSVDEARALLVDQRLEVGEILTNDSALPRDQVIRSEPAFGEVVQEGTAITLVVASGSNTVPQLRGLEEAEARQLLEAAGFEVDVETVLDTTQPAGTVISAAPAGGVRQEVGSTVVLTVAQAGEASRVRAPSGAGRAVLGTATAPTGEATASTTETLTATATVTETETVTEAP